MRLLMLSGTTVFLSIATLTGTPKLLHAAPSGGHLSAVGGPVSLSRIKSALRRHHYERIDFTSTSGAFVEVEACRDSVHYFMQIGRNGHLLQRVELGECAVNIADRLQGEFIEGGEEREPENTLESQAGLSGHDRVLPSALVSSEEKRTDSVLNRDIAEPAEPVRQKKARRIKSPVPPVSLRKVALRKKAQVRQPVSAQETRQNRPASIAGQARTKRLLHKVSLDKTGRKQRKLAVIYPDKKPEISTLSQKTVHPRIRKHAGFDPLKLLRKHGYRHILVPANRKLGIMACKNGREYGFNITARRVESYSDMLVMRRAYGKCFGYGKQILNRHQLLKIMRRHGDRHIRLVRATLPMFEAVSCYRGKRRQVKINRWGNDNVRVIGKCRR